MPLPTDGFTTDRIVYHVAGTGSALFQFDISLDLSQFFEVSGAVAELIAPLDDALVAYGQAMTDLSIVDDVQITKTYRGAISPAVIFPVPQP